jgi:hypothetical protein
MLQIFLKTSAISAQDWERAFTNIIHDGRPKYPNVFF